MGCNSSRDQAKSSSQNKKGNYPSIKVTPPSQELKRQSSKDPAHPENAQQPVEPKDTKQEVKERINAAGFVASQEVNKIMKALVGNRIDNSPNLGDDYALFLDLEKNSDGVHSFLRQAKELQFDTLRKVRLLIPHISYSYS